MPSLGLWDSLSTDQRSTSLPEGKELVNAQFEDAPTSFGGNVPMSFGSRDGGGHRGGMGRGKGISKDLKGVDWNCSNCDNLNWSWRSTCNKCGTAKPQTLMVQYTSTLYLIP